jgi:hypothetical protein
LEANQFIMDAIEAVLLGAEDAQTALDAANQNVADLLAQ